MKVALLLIMCLLVAATTVSAQGGFISVYSDAGGFNCLITDTAPGLLPIYVVHGLTPAGATASQWSAPMPGCMTGALFLSDTPTYPVTIGNSQVGVAIGYGACVGGQNLILTINLFAAGLSQPCCEYRVLPDPAVASGNIEAVDCSSNLLVANGGIGWVNSNGLCGCEPATETATWGRVKAVYFD